MDLSQNVKTVEERLAAAARAAGLEVVGVYDPFYAHREGELRQACHRYIRSFTELLE